jgi:phosphoribosyl-AMP cyclohydrolase / phosphoribosyl-ATP pyrophosphohydrolase
MLSLTSRSLRFDSSSGLAPAIVQHATTGHVLMLGYVNDESLKITMGKGNVTFFSRSKNRLWTKGETSGNFLKVVSLHVDCDGDSLLIKAIPQGPTCHTGSDTCFEEYIEEDGHPAFLMHLESVLKGKKTSVAPLSYTEKLFKEGTPRIAQKVGEEGVEVVIAAMKRDAHELVNESADLLLHLLTLLVDQGIPFSNVISCLKQRHDKRT